MSIIDQLNAVSRLQGRPPIDPTVIEGGTPPLDGEPQDVSRETIPELPDEAFEEPSPLVNLARRMPPPDVPRETIPSLVLLDRVATFKDQKVDLDDAEYGAIASIVLRAIERRVKVQLAEIRKSLPKQVRVRRKRKPK
jgi:hypothetical protein